MGDLTVGNVVDNVEIELFLNGYHAHLLDSVCDIVSINNEIMVDK